MIVGPAKFDERDTTKAEGRSLTAREAVEGVSAGEHADVLRESVAVRVREITELEVAQLAGAELGKPAPGRRQAQRNGYRDRPVGHAGWEIELAIPRLRTGSCLPSFLEPCRRNRFSALPAGLFMNLCPSASGWSGLSARSPTQRLHHLGPEISTR